MNDALVEAVWRHMGIALPGDLNAYPGYQIVRAALDAIEMSGTHRVVELRGLTHEQIEKKMVAEARRLLLSARPKQEDVR